jgi:tetratricopeptide (TPR) repeat protein
VQTRDGRARALRFRAKAGLALSLYAALLGQVTPAPAQTSAGAPPEQQNAEQIEQAVVRYEGYLAHPAPGTTAAAMAPIRVRLGTAYFLLKRYPESLQALAPVVSAEPAARPEDADARLMYSQALLVSGLDHLQLNEATEAVAPLRRALVLDDGNANARMALGDALARTHQMDLAEQEYEAQLRLTPSLADAWYKLGMVHVELAGNTQRTLTERAAGSVLSQQLSAESLLAGEANWDAARILLQLTKAAPEQPEVHADLGRALFALGYVKTAAEAFRKELAFDPQDPLAMLGWAEVAAFDSQWAEAKTRLDELARSQPGELARLAESAPPGPLRQAWNNAAVKIPGDVAGTPEGIFWKMWLTNSSVSAGVLSPVAGSAVTCPSLPSEDGARAGVWLSEACYRRLLETLRRRGALSAATRTRLAETMFRLGDYDGALHQAQALLRLRPQDAWALYWVSRAHAELAGDCFEKVALLNPESPRVHQMLAERYLGWGQFAQAEAEYQTAIRLAPDLPDLFLGLGDTYTHMLDWARAAAEYQKTLQLAPGSLAARAELGHAYAKLGQWQQAIVELRQIPPNSPRAAAARLDLANAENEVGETGQAIADLLPYEAQDKDGEIHFRLAVFYRRMGDTDAAKQATLAFQKLRAAQLAVSHGEIQALEDERQSAGSAAAQHPE